MPALSGAQLLRLARRVADDTVTPYATSDADFFLYLALAEEEFARNTHCLRTVVTAASTVGESKIQYDLFPPIVEIRSARITSPAYGKLTIIGPEDETAHSIMASHSARRGVPKEVIVGRSNEYMQLLPVPDAVYTIDFDIIHLPEDSIAGNGDYPTIPEQWHAFLPIGAARLAMKHMEDEEYFVPKRYESIVDEWAKAMFDASSQVNNLSREAPTIEFHGNDLWA